MAVITSKTILRPVEEFADDPVRAPKGDSELEQIINQIKDNCSPVSEISRLCDRALDLIQNGGPKPRKRG